MEILNREAKFNYFIEDEIECGISLVGTEIKSIRDGKANLKDSYAIIRNNEVLLLNMHINEYKEGNMLFIHICQLLIWHMGYIILIMKYY